MKQSGICVGWHGGWPAALLGVLATLAGCAAADRQSVADFDRHRYSQLVQSYARPGVIFFDVAYPPQYPRDSLEGEDARLGWLAGWMKLRGLCPAGYDVQQRRPFDYLEDNPAGYAERWEVACRAAPPAPAG